MRKKNAKKQKKWRLCWPPIFFINKYVYIAKSPFLFISKILKMKLSLKFGKIARNCLRNLAVSF